MKAQITLLWIVTLVSSQIISEQSAIGIQAEAMDLELQSLSARPWINNQYRLIFNTKGGISPYIFSFAGLPEGWVVQGSSILFPQTTLELTQKIKILVKVQDSSDNFLQKTVTLSFTGTNKQKIALEIQQIQDRPINNNIRSQNIQPQISYSLIDTINPPQQYTNNIIQSNTNLQNSLFLLQNSLNQQNIDRISCQANLADTKSQRSLIEGQIQISQQKLSQTLSQIQVLQSQIKQKNTTKYELFQQINQTKIENSPSSDTYNNIQQKLAFCQRKQNQSSQLIEQSLKQQNKIDSLIVQKQLQIEQTNKYVQNLRIDLGVINNVAQKLREQLAKVEMQQLQIKQKISKQFMKPQKILKQIDQLLDQKKALQRNIRTTQLTTENCTMYQRQLSQLSQKIKINGSSNQQLQQKFNQVQKELNDLLLKVQELELDILQISKAITQSEKNLSVTVDDVLDISNRCMKIQENIRNLQFNINQIKQLIAKKPQTRDNVQPIQNQQQQLTNRLQISTSNNQQIQQQIKPSTINRQISQNFRLDRIIGSSNQNPNISQSQLQISRLQNQKNNQQQQTDIKQSNNNVTINSSIIRPRFSVADQVKNITQQSKNQQQISIVQQPSSIIQETPNSQLFQAIPVQQNQSQRQIQNSQNRIQTNNQQQNIVPQFKLDSRVSALLQGLKIDLTQEEVNAYEQIQGVSSDNQENPQISNTSISIPVTSNTLSIRNNQDTQSINYLLSLPTTFTLISTSPAQFQVPDIGQFITKRYQIEDGFEYRRTPGSLFTISQNKLQSFVKSLRQQSCQINLSQELLTGTAIIQNFDGIFIMARDSISSKQYKFRLQSCTRLGSFTKNDQLLQGTWFVYKSQLSHEQQQTSEQFILYQIISLNGIK